MTIKNYGHIVNKQFKVNRKRNISTISGIMLSIILFSIMGYVQTYSEYVNILDAKARNGNYEAVFTDLSLEQVDQLRNNILIKEVGLYTDMYDSTIKIGDKEKIIKVHAVDNVILKDMFSSLIKINNGRIPEKDNEILIDTVGKEFLHKKMGDILKIGEKEYIIVGTYDKINTNRPYDIDILTYFNEKDLLNKVNVALNVESNNNKLEIINKISKDININIDENIFFNNLLFNNYNGEYYKQSYEENITEIMLYGCVLVLTVFMTYGSINISLKERIKQFSILRCIGATPMKIRMLLIKESLFLALLSIIPGIILGQLICYFISSVILQRLFETNITYQFYPNLIVKVALLSIMNIALSTIIPVVKVGKISPVEGVANAREINKKLKVKNSKILKKLFGYNGLLAYKNIRGNKISFFITTITSTMILTIFIVFSGYSSTLIDVYNREQREMKDLNIEIYMDEKEYSNDTFEQLDIYKKEIEGLGVTKEVFGQVHYFLEGVFEEVELNEKIKNKNDYLNYGEANIIVDNKISTYSDSINILVLDDNSLQEILNSIEDKSLTLDDFKDNGVLILKRMVSSNFFNFNKESLFDLDKNDKLILRIEKNDNENSYISMEEKMEYISKNGRPIELKYLGSIDADKFKDIKKYENMTTLILSREFYDDSKAYMKNKRISFEMNLKEDIDREIALRSIENYTNKKEGYITDNQQSSLFIRNQMIVVSSMVYLVLFLTIIVGGLNLINNKYISIKLRGKEMGTLLAIGINKKRLKNILILEAIIQWLISVVISLILSYIILTIMYKAMIFTSGINQGKMPILQTILGCGILLIINMMGSYLPIRKLKYTNTSELMRNQE